VEAKEFLTAEILSMKIDEVILVMVVADVATDGRYYKAYTTGNSVIVV